jgi:hypothetical protein
LDFVHFLQNDRQAMILGRRFISETEQKMMLSFLFYTLLLLRVMQLSLLFDSMHAKVASSPFERMQHQFFEAIKNYS